MCVLQEPRKPGEAELVAGGLYSHLLKRKGGLERRKAFSRRPFSANTTSRAEDRKPKGQEVLGRIHSTSTMGQRLKLSMLICIGIMPFTGSKGQHLRQ